MAKNKSGGLKGNVEWGSKARKNEDALRGRNNSARRETIEEGLIEVLEPPACGHRWYWSDSRNAFICLSCGGVDEA